MSNEVKGNIFALKLLMSNPDTVQYVIHTLLFILFLYWYTVAIMTHTEEAFRKKSLQQSCTAGQNNTKEGLIPGKAMLRSDWM